MNQIANVCFGSEADLQPGTACKWQCYNRTDSGVNDMPAKPTIVRNIARSPFVIFPLGAAVIVVLLSAWFAMDDDTLAVNQGFLGFLVAIPVIVALCLVAGGRFWNLASTRNIGRWLWSWLGSSVLALVFASVAFAVVGPVDTAAYADYNYLHFDRDAYITADQRQVAAGGLALDQTIYDLDGNEVQLSTLWQSRPVVIEFGSVSCPVFDSRISPMEQLANDYQGQADFYVLYTREAHPGQNYPAHQSLTDKIGFARDLKRIEGIERTVLVDDVAGTMHRAYGAWPDSAYIIGQDGVIGLLTKWNEPDKLRERLDILLEDGGYAAASAPVNLDSNSPGGGPTMMESSRRVLGRAGFAAVADFVVGYPKMMWSSSPTSTEPAALVADTSPDGP